MPTFFLPTAKNASVVHSRGCKPQKRAILSLNKGGDNAKVGDTQRHNG